ncbi:MAG: TspO/MBR family protein, partial [Candidatus Hinthialibacter sp.]
YTTLEKPFWNPPSWVFAPVWTFLYGCMAVAGWLVWSSGNWKQIKLEMSLFFIQLGFNLAWSILFFGLQNPFVALIDILALWGFIMAAMISFLKFSRWAFFLMLLYLAWVTYAMTLNFAIILLN